VLAIIDPFSGVAGDMFLGALVDLGLEKEFLERLPATLGLDGIGVRVARVQKCGIGAVKVDFDIPPQPHGRHLKHILEIVDRCPAPASVKTKAGEAFRLIATIEAQVHGTTIEKVHLHEVGAVDAILDIVGSVWGAEQLGISEIRCGPIALGDGHVDAQHGRMPVPAPATARLVEGLVVAAGPPGSGELTTPTGAALVRVLSTGLPPATFIPRRTGYGAGTKAFSDRPNVLRVTLAELPVDEDAREELLLLTADIDDSTAEHLAAAAESLRAAGALDVTLSAVIMKKGRLGTRLEVLCQAADAVTLEDAILTQTSTIGVRRAVASRRALQREFMSVMVLGHRIRVKRVTLPDGSTRVKPEFDDVQAAALATGRLLIEISSLATAQTEANGPVGGV
jgi:hypothetical protein